jgi:glycerol kinase
LVIGGTAVDQVFVDGGFGHNDIFMQLLAAALPQMKIYAASLAQATALGAAMAIHKDWNSRPMPAGLIQVKFIAGSK